MVLGMEVVRVRGILRCMPNDFFSLNEEKEKANNHQPSQCSIYISLADMRRRNVRCDIAVSLSGLMIFFAA